MRELLRHIVLMMSQLLLTIGLLVTCVTHLKTVDNRISCHFLMLNSSNNLLYHHEYDFSAP